MNYAVNTLMKVNQKPLNDTYKQLSVTARANFHEECKIAINDITSLFENHMEEIFNTMQHSIQNIELFHQDSVETLTTLIEENSKLPAKKESNSSSNNDSRFFCSTFTMNTHGNYDCSFPIDNSHKK